MSTVLVTGASSGIGRATAAELARRGHRVVATARNPQTLDDLDVDLRLGLDVTDQASVDAAVAAAGPVDALVSNAGVIFYAPVEATPIAELERIWQANTVGALRVTQAVLPGMRARGGGRVVYVSSAAGRVALPAGGAYGATKWALEALAETLAIEAQPYGIHVSLMQPGPVSSGALDDVTRYDTPDHAYGHVESTAPDGAGFDSPEFVAAAVADALELDDPPLRIPVGERATALLAARHAAPDDRPFAR